MAGLTGRAVLTGLFLMFAGRCALAQTITGPSFQVNVTLSSAAIAQLANSHETTVVEADFFGVPASERLRMADQGRLPLSPEQKIELSGPGVARFAGPKYAKSKLGQVQGGQVHVALEGYSGRHSNPDNILNCDATDMTLQVAAAKPFQMNCKLLSEP